MTQATLDAGFDEALAKAQAEQSKDQAPPEPVKEAEAAASAPETTEEKQPEPAQSAEGSDELLPLEEYERLRKDPEALRKALNKAFTQKTQSLAVERKAMEEQQKALEPYRELIDAFDQDPQGTVKALAEKLGINIQQADTKQEAKEAAGEMLTELRKDLGPDLEFLADKLAPTLERAVQRIAAQAVSKEVEPLKQQAQKMQEETIVQQIDANLELFTKKHPDWKKHEAKMTEIGMRLQPVADSKTGKAPTWMEYMNDLYFLATKDSREGDIAKQTVERMKQAAEKAESSESGTSGQKVAKTAPKGKSFDEAFDQSWKDAQAGVTYES